MNSLETFLSWTMLSFEVVWCVFILSARARRVLPLFSAFAFSTLFCTVSVWLTYNYFGFHSDTSYYVGWGSTYVIAVFRSLAIAELCRHELRRYRGIWALAWRILSGVSILFCIHAAIDAWGQPNGVAIYGATLNRDLALGSFGVIVLLLLIRNYYGLELGRLQRLVALGLVVTCAVDAVGNTLFRDVLTNRLYAWFLASQKALWPSLASEIQQVNDVWSAVHLFAFMAAMGIWCYALRKPVAEESAAPDLLPAHVYRELSPAINLRLNAFNDRLLELLKP